MNDNTLMIYLVFGSLFVSVLGGVYISALFSKRKVKYFRPGSRSEVQVIIAVNNYLSTFYPAFVCSANVVSRDLSIEDEVQQPNKLRYRVTFLFKCHETCRVNNKKFSVLVDVSDPMNIDIVRPINDEQIKEYKTEY